MGVLSKEQIAERIAAGWLVVGSPDLDAALQPNGIDLTVEEVEWFPLAGNSQLGIASSDRVLPATEPVVWRDDWTLLVPGVYLLRLAETIRLPLDVMARTLPRSSVLRMGHTINTAVWDAGYEGRGQVQLVVARGALQLQRGARVVQMVFEELDSATGSGYAGAYQHEGGR